MNIESLIHIVLSLSKDDPREKVVEKVMSIIDVDQMSDGYHTFDELYMHRRVLFSIICHQYPHLAWKSWKHSDGTMFDDCFVVGIKTPEGQYSYHYGKQYWDEFKVPVLKYAPTYDGHQPKDITRLVSLLSKQNFVSGTKHLTDSAATDNKWESGKLGTIQEFAEASDDSPTSYTVNLIYARHYLNNGIGYDGEIVWKCEEDMQFFLNKIKGKVCVVGRKTAEKLPKNLPCKELLVLTKQSTRGTMTFEEMDQYLNDSGVDEIFVIGGKEIYELFLSENVVDRIFESVLFIDLFNEQINEFDTFFNADKTGFKFVHSHRTDGRIPCYFNTFEREVYP